MSEDDIIIKYEEYIEEVEGGLTNLKYRLGIEWDDVKQDTLIKLIQKNRKDPLSMETFKGLLFVMLKNTAIKATNKLRSDVKVDDEEVHIQLTNDDEVLFDKDDNELLKQIKDTLSTEEYEHILKYYDTIYTKKSMKNSQQIDRIKKKLGYKKKTYQLITPSGEKLPFETLTDIAEHIGIDNAYMSLKTNKANGQFTYKKEIWIIKTISIFN